MTGKYQHTDYIKVGQRVNRHSLSTLLYFLFSLPCIFFNSILASRTMAHLVLPDTEANPSQNQKSHFCQRFITFVK
jgi:hypothetical protein